MPFSAKALTSRSVVSCARGRRAERRAPPRARKRGDEDLRAAIHGRRLLERCRTGACGGPPTLPRRRRRGQGVCLEPAAGAAPARRGSLSAASYRDDLGPTHVRPRGVLDRAHGFAGRASSPFRFGLANAVANVGARQQRYRRGTTKLEPPCPAGISWPRARATSVSSRTLRRDRADPLADVHASGSASLRRRASACRRRAPAGRPP